MIIQIVKSVAPFAPTTKNPATGKSFAIPLAFTVTVTFTDDVTGITDDIIYQNITSNLQLARLVQLQLDQYKNAQVLTVTPPKIGAPVDLSILTSPIVLPTQEELDQQKYNGAIGLLNQYQQLLTNGVIQPGDTDLANALQFATKLYQSIEAPILQQKLADLQK